MEHRMIYGVPERMVTPSMKRLGIWNGGIIQIVTTRACDLACFGCTAGSNLVSKPAVMTPEQFEEAVASLDGYWGVVGCFGGNPCTSRYFEDYCRILRARVPFPQRGLWTNNLMGKGSTARITFNPATSNVNVHMQSEAYAEFERDWPEALDARKAHTTAGLTQDSLHGTPWISMVDAGIPEEQRIKLIGSCDINATWSAAIAIVGGRPRAFLCEIQAHMAALHADNADWAGSGEAMPDWGLEVEPGWWRKPLAEFANQVGGMCHHCAIPMRRPGQFAIGGEAEEFSETHRHIARPKAKQRPVRVIESIGVVERSARPSTEYLPHTSPSRR